MLHFRCLLLIAVIATCTGGRLRRRGLTERLLVANTNYCGVSWADAAANCGEPCPSGSNGECPQGQQCYGDITCATVETTNYCGSSWTDATNCENSCPGGVDNECPPGQQCYGGITMCNDIDRVETTNYCGSSWTDATNCENSCPGGVDNECPPGQQCYGGITTCNNVETTNYCGSSWTDATNCENSCPGGVDSECPPGQQCYGGITACSNIETTNYCGSSWTDATNCENSCPGGVDSECPSGQQCYGGVTSCNTAPVDTTNYCGSSWDDAAQCKNSCPGGVDRECPSGQRCFADVTSCGVRFPTPSPVPTTSAFPSASTSPSQAPTAAGIEFHGFKNAYSIIQGRIDLSWNPPIAEEPFSEEDVVYDVFVAIGEYDFTSMLTTGGLTIEDLIHLFESNPDHQHVEIPGDVYETSINSMGYGEVHTLLITAQVNGVFSTNTRTSKVVVARFSPHVRDEVSIIGVFVPTANIRIQVEDAPLGEEHHVTFSGSGVTIEARSLRAGDYFSGFTSELDTFVRRVVEPVVIDLDQIILRVVDVPLEEIFDRLDLDGAFGISQENNGNSDLDVRQLWGFISDIGNAIVDFGGDVIDGVVDGAKAIGDFAVDTVVTVVEFLEDFVTGELEERFTLMDLQETWEEEIIPDHAKLSGGMHFKAEFVIQIHIDGILPDFVRVGVEADYSCESTLSLEAQYSREASKEIELWHGKKKSKIFMLGVVPVEAYWQPKIDLKMEAEVSLSASAQIGIKVEGSTEISAIYDKDHSPKFYERFTPPSLDPTYCLEIQSEASLEASTAVVLSMEVGLYRGLLSTSTGISVGLVMESGIGFEEAQTSGQFDLKVAFSVPFKADALFEEYSIVETDLYEKEWPILSLAAPSVELGFLQRHLCSCSQMCSLDGDWESAGSNGPCSGDTFFDNMSNDLREEFNNEIFLSQAPDPNDPPFPSTVYKFEDFMTALKNLQNAGDEFQFWLGDDCSVASQKAALVNMAAFLGQAMRETIIYDACDENNWDKWNSAYIPKEPTSPPEYAPALYPMSSGCGQLGQNYAEYDCDDACPQDPTMELTATTNADWIGAPPPLFCGPRSKYDGLGYWNPMLNCPDGDCNGQPFHYENQQAGVYVPVHEDHRYPAFFYANPLADGVSPRSTDSLPATNVEGCCWWGRGVIQTTGRCNFGKLNKRLGAGAGSDALYPEINFCRNPQAVCEGPSDLKWVAGIFFWVSDPQVYNRDGFNYKDGVNEFVRRGCADDPDGEGCDFLFEYASGIVNRGCHDPGETGCPGCVPGATCDPAHNIPERVEASKQVLRALMKTLT